MTTIKLAKLDFLITHSKLSLKDSRYKRRLILLMALNYANWQTKIAGNFVYWAYIWGDAYEAHLGEHIPVGHVYEDLISQACLSDKDEQEWLHAIIAHLTNLVKNGKPFIIEARLNIEDGWPIQGPIVSSLLAILERMYKLHVTQFPISLLEELKRLLTLDTLSKPILLRNADFVDITTDINDVLNMDGNTFMPVKLLFLIAEAFNCVENAHIPVDKFIIAAKMRDLILERFLLQC